MSSTLNKCEWCGKHYEEAAPDAELPDEYCSAWCEDCAYEDDYVADDLDDDDDYLDEEE